MVVIVSEPPDLEMLAGELRVVIGRLVRRLRAEHGFPLTHGSVLGRLDRGGVASIGDLASAERVRPQSMTQTIADLEAVGLVARHPDPADGRRILIELTDRGRRALAEDRAQREGWLAEAIAEDLTPAERRVLARALPLLERLAEA
jgi:DNA-binding MarR family transcriptional regulator